jgi:hypothetical protein
MIGAESLRGSGDDVPSKAATSHDRIGGQVRGDNRFPEEAEGQLSAGLSMPSLPNMAFDQAGA